MLWQGSNWTRRKNQVYNTKMCQLTSMVVDTGDGFTVTSVADLPHSHYNNIICVELFASQYFELCDGFKILATYWVRSKRD